MSAIAARRKSRLAARIFQVRLLGVALTGILIGLLAGVAAMRLTSRDCLSIIAYAVQTLGPMAALVLACLSLSRARRRERNLTGVKIRRLAGKLRARNAELRRLHSHASERLRERSLVYAAASHDLGQRMLGLKLLASTLSGDAPRSSQVTNQHLHEVVSDLDRYVHHVLDFARLEGNPIPPRFEMIYLQDLFQNTLVHFEASALDRGVDLRVRANHAELPGDPRLLSRIVDNLVGNAIKFSRGGVLLAARKRGARWRIEVWDQGPGIAPEHLESIFEPFHRLDQARDHYVAGSGLGLAISRCLAKSQGLRIVVKSRPGSGSTFIVESID